MVVKILQRLDSLRLGQYRKRRHLDKVRRLFEGCGHTVDDRTDSELEAAITHYGGRLGSSLPLTGKRMYWILRRLSSDGEQLPCEEARRRIDLDIGNK